MSQINVFTNLFLKCARPSPWAGKLWVQFCYNPPNPRVISNSSREAKTPRVSFSVQNEMAAAAGWFITSILTVWSSWTTFQSVLEILLPTIYCKTLRNEEIFETLDDKRHFFLFMGCRKWNQILNFFANVNLNVFYLIRTLVLWLWDSDVYNKVIWIKKRFKKIILLCINFFLGFC